MQEKKSIPPMSDAQVEEAARLFKTLSEPARLHLIKALMPGPLTVSELVERSKMKQGTVSKHLGVLHTSGLLEREREGSYIRYRITDPCLFELCGLVCGKIERDAKQRLDRLAGA